jgi:large-conductance mechanosensitive channel
MELIIIVSTITAFFSHFLIEKSIVANAVSIIVATAITWVVVRAQSDNLVEPSLTAIGFAVVAALFVSLVVGLVFAQHKKCSK